MKVTYPTLITPDSVIVLKGGKRLICHSNHPCFNKIKDRIRAQNYNNIEQLFKLKEVFEKQFNVTVQNNQVFYKGEIVHNVLCDKILTFIRDGLPYKPLMKFLNKLWENPSKDSRDTLYSYLEKHKLPIDNDGNFFAVKAISANWMDKYSGIIKNTIGKPIRMPREQVCATKEECGSMGLHVGSEKYVFGYGIDDDIFILVKVNPKNVVVVPIERDYGKIRVCEYTPIAKISRDNLNFTSDFAPKINQYKLIERVDTKKNHLNQNRNKFGQFC